MLKIVFLFLYIWKGEVVLEQKPMPDIDVCIAQGQARIEEVQKDPRFDAGLFADCFPMFVTEAKN